MMRRLVLVSILLFALAGTLVAAPTPITIYRGGIGIDWAKDPVVLALNKKLDVQLSFITAPWADNAAKINLILASGEAVDIVTTVGDIPKWAAEGAIIALDPYLTLLKHPYLYKIVNSKTFQPMKIDGKAYTIPQLPLGVAWATFLRKDWMDKVGITGMPKNEEDLYKLLKAFKDSDPTGTTTGLQFEGTAQIRRTTIPIMTMFGVPTSFWDQVVNFDISKAGKLTHIAVMENTKAALKYMNRLYNDGLINADFPSMNSFPNLVQKYLMSGKAGAGWVISPLTGQEASLQKVDPKARFALMPPVAATGYTFRRAQGVLAQSNAVVTSVSKNPAKAIECLEFFNSWEGRKLLVAGVEGVHYKSISKDGLIDRIQDAWDRDYPNMLYHPLNFYLGQGNCEGYVPAANYATFEEAYGNSVPFIPVTMKDKPNVMVEYKEGAKWFGDPNPLQFVQFVEYNDLRNELDQGIINGWIKCIAAKPGTFDAEYAAYLAELKRVGLDKWVALYQGYYDKNLKGK